MHTIHNSILSTTADHAKAIDTYLAAKQKGNTILNTSDGFKILDNIFQVFWQKIRVLFGATNRISDAATELNLGKHIFYQYTKDFATNTESKWLAKFSGEKLLFTNDLQSLINIATSKEPDVTKRIDSMQQILFAIQKKNQAKIQPGFWMKKRVTQLPPRQKTSVFGHDLLVLVRQWKGKTLSAKESSHLNNMLRNGIDGIQDQKALDNIFEEVKGVRFTLSTDVQSRYEAKFAPQKMVEHFEKGEFEKAAFFAKKTNHRKLYIKNPKASTISFCFNNYEKNKEKLTSKESLNKLFKSLTIDLAGNEYLDLQNAYGEKETHKNNYAFLELKALFGSERIIIASLFFFHLLQEKKSDIKDLSSLIADQLHILAQANPELFIKVRNEAFNDIKWFEFNEPWYLLLDEKRTDNSKELANLMVSDFFDNNTKEESPDEDLLSATVLIDLLKHKQITKKHELALQKFGKNNNLGDFLHNFHKTISDIEEYKKILALVKDRSDFPADLKKQDKKEIHEENKKTIIENDDDHKTTNKDDNLLKTEKEEEEIHEESKITTKSKKDDNLLIFENENQVKKEELKETKLEETSSDEEIITAPTITLEQANEAWKKKFKTTHLNSLGETKLFKENKQTPNKRKNKVQNTSIKKQNPWELILNRNANNLSNQQYKTNVGNFIDSVTSFEKKNPGSLAHVESDLLLMVLDYAVVKKNVELFDAIKNNTSLSALLIRQFEAPEDALKKIEETFLSSK